MKTNMLKIWTAVVVLALALSTSAAANGGGGGPFLQVDLSPYEGLYGDQVIEIPPGDVETLYIHLSEVQPSSVAPAGVVYCLESPPSTHSRIVGGPEATATWDVAIGPGFCMAPSTWYIFGTVTIDGEPSTTIAISVDLELAGGVIFDSNEIYKHITPEPSSILALATGVFGIGGLLLRRRRS